MNSLLVLGADLERRHGRGLRRDITAPEMMMMAHAALHDLYVFDRCGFYVCAGNVHQLSDRLEAEYEAVNSACVRQYEKHGEAIEAEEATHIADAERYRNSLKKCE